MLNRFDGGQEAGRSVRAARIRDVGFDFWSDTLISAKRKRARALKSCAAEAARAVRTGGPVGFCARVVWGSSL